MRFYDSATAAVRDFTPLIPGQASLYYCGATVQSEPHIGHLRSAIVFDQLTRWLQFRGYQTTVIRNVTDIDDKILAKAAEAGEEWWARAYRYEGQFAAAYDALGVTRPDYEPRATGHIPEMHQLITELINAGHAYPATDGSGDVYFDVRSWPQYGTLTHQSIADMQAAPDADPRAKRDPRDFALWKGRKADEPATASWNSPWGPGRPGWHLECSAMVGKYLGPEFDIHGGGLDLRFPHHENEMAQSQASGRGFAQLWMHNGMVTYQGEKMSKSVGNVIAPEEMFALASPRVIRYYLGQAHYRSVLDYNQDSLAEAAAALARIDGFVVKALRATDAADTAVPGMFNQGGFFAFAPLAAKGELTAKFEAAMDDDLNVPQALAQLHERVRAGNSALDSGDLEAAAANLAATQFMISSLGLAATSPNRQGENAAGSSKEAQALDALLTAKLAKRAEARAAKDWARSDAIRDELGAAGVKIADGPNGATWSLDS